MIRILFVYANPYLKCLVSPYGLEIIQSALDDLQIETKTVDPFLLSEHPGNVIAQLIREFKPDIIAVSIRNIDDAIVIDRASLNEMRHNHSHIDIHGFLGAVKEVTDVVRSEAGDVFTIVGGAGFTFCPKEMLHFLEMSIGVIGPGEYVMRRLAEHFIAGHSSKKALEEFSRRLPGVVWQDGDEIGVNPPDIEKAIALSHRVRRERVYQVSAMISRSYVPVRVSTGCNGRCSYCVEHVNMEKVQDIPVGRIVREVEDLVETEHATKIHFTCSEFNLTGEERVIEICDTLVERGLHERISWTAYFNVVPFSDRMAKALVRSNGRNIEFTVDSFSNGILRNAAKGFQSDDALCALRLAERYGISCGASLIFGLPGENDETIECTISRMRELASEMIHFT